VNTRIGEAERNRPAALSNGADAVAPQQAQAFGEAFRAMLANGIPPEEVADAVVEAIRHDRVYILTNEDTKERIRSRLGRILIDTTTAAV
jgi:hypothetical protein